MTIKEVICAWCKRTIESPQTDPKGTLVSHGICDECRRQVLNKEEQA
jgi:DNA-directed RNA polymerase subunit RPC12/RpoP